MAASSLFTILILAVILRVIPIIYLDSYQSIPDPGNPYNPLLPRMIITDIDYKVATDATHYQSPYDRHTYRYTPFISYMMQYNDIKYYIGKLGFVVADFLAIIFLYLTIKKSKAGSDSSALTLCKMYAYNPIFIYLTVRGSFESITIMFMYSFCYFWYQGSEANSDCLLTQPKQVIKKQDNSFISISQIIAYVLFGLWVHYRIYPIVFVPFLLFEKYKTSTNFMNFIWKFAKFGFISGVVFLGLIFYFYQEYGHKFLHETYLYHFTRKDNRHSFSPYFYQTYLTMATQILNKAHTTISDIIATSFDKDVIIDWIIGLNISKLFVRILPQFYLILSLTFKMRVSSLMKMFVLTYAFVSFNRVITMQYYMWILGALLLVLPQSQLFIKKQARKAMSYFLQWVLGIALWVWLSMQLQGYGQNVFLLIWAIDVIKLFWDLWIMHGFLSTVKGTNLIQQYQKKNRQAIKQKTA